VEEVLLFRCYQTLEIAKAWRCVCTVAIGDRIVALPHSAIAFRSIFKRVDIAHGYDRCA
jgi:hypothetical protein